MVESLNDPFSVLSLDDPFPMPVQPPVKVVQEQEQIESEGVVNWVTKTTCLLKLKTDPVTSCVLRVFANKQLLVTMTDSDKFGFTVSTQRIDVSPEAALDLDEEDIETAASMLLLGDRTSQKVAEILANDLFKTLTKKEAFAGVEGMVL